MNTPTITQEKKTDRLGSAFTSGAENSRQSHFTTVPECVYLVAGSLYPGDHNQGKARCRDCRGTILPGAGVKVYTWNGWTNFHLCGQCARWRVEGVMFYWNRAFDSWMFTFDVYKAEVSGDHLAELIWGLK